MIRIQQVGGALVNAVGIGEKKASGPLCICRSADEVAEKFQPGDVLVVPYTTNELLPYIRQAAAVITEEASAECHTATIGLALDKPCDRRSRRRCSAADGWHDGHGGLRPRAGPGHALTCLELLQYNRILLEAREESFLPGFSAPSAYR